MHAGPARTLILFASVLGAVVMAAPAAAGAEQPRRDAATIRAEKAFTKLVYERYGDPGPIVSCRKTARTRWRCSFEAYTGGGQLCTGPGAGTVRRVGNRYRASLDRSKVTCEEA